MLSLIVQTTNKNSICSMDLFIIYFYCKHTNFNCLAVFYIPLSINKIMGIYQMKLDMYTIVQECMALTNKKYS